MFEDSVFGTLLIYKNPDDMGETKLIGNRYYEIS